MEKREEKITRAAHIKRHTVGTSNEISFSVLDAVKNSLDDGRSDKEDRGSLFGRIALFTLPGRRKKPTGTPTKESGLPLSTGDFVSVDGKEGSTHFDTLDFQGSGAPAPSHALPDINVSSGSVKAAQSSVSVSSGATGSFGMSPEKGRSHTSASAKPVRSSEEEIARRKARRRLSKIVAVAVVVVISAVLLAFGGNYLYRDYQLQQGNIAQLDEALELVKQADETIIALDGVLADPFADGAADKRTSVMAGITQATDQLVAADKKARNTSENLRDSRDKEAANQAVATIAARQTLIDTGTQLMEAGQAAQTAVQYVRSAWDKVLQADDKARSAAALVTETTAEHVETSKAMTSEAAETLAAARSDLEEAQAAYADADLATLFAYVDKRVESLGYAIASDEAVLARNKEEAASQNDLYNTTDAEAASLAKKLPSDPSSIVVDAFDKTTANLAETYSTARSQAGTADAFIRDYLGTEVK